MQFLRGLIETGVRNPVLANLLLVCMVVGGLAAARSMVREAYPEYALDHITVEVFYPGASTEDVERTICVPIEEAVRGIQGVRQVSASAQANYGYVFVALTTSVTDPDQVLKDVKDAVDQISTFPPAAEKPIITEMVIRSEVISIAIHGDVPERTLKRIAQDVRNDLESLADISEVSLSGVREDEIIIDVSRVALRSYDLSLSDIIAVVKRNSLDLPAGILKTLEEEFTLRVTGTRFTAADYEDLVVIDRPEGQVVLSDLARVRDGFEDITIHGRFDGDPAVLVSVYKTPDQDATKIARIVREYVEQRQDNLSAALKMTYWADGSRDIEDRITMLVKNGLMGIILVFLTLWMFLELRVAFWVAAGIPIAFAGALMIMDFNGESLNMMSLFALIMVSGIIVDDAIVIAESIHTHRREGLEPALAATNGTMRVALPVLGSSLTTILTFIPLLYVIGVMGRFVHAIPVVVIAAIAASAVEAFGILPSHLTHRTRLGRRAEKREPSQLRERIDRGVDRFITGYYRPAYRAALRYRGVTVAVAVSVCAIVAGLVISGRSAFVLLPKEDGNLLRARVQFPEGTPYGVTRATIAQLEDAARGLNDDPELTPAGEGKLVRHVYAIAGEFADFLPQRGSNLLEIRIELLEAEKRQIPDEDIMARWRERAGDIYDAMSYSIQRQQIGPTERPIEVRLLGTDLAELADASLRLQNRLREFEGVTEVTDDLWAGKRELQVVGLKPAARMLGLTLDDVARQLRNGFFGGEAVRVFRDRDEVRVRVRYPDEERQSISDLERMRIRTPHGREVPFSEVADVQWTRGYARIMHQDGKRRVRVMADIDERLANAEKITQDLEAEFLPDLTSRYNDVRAVFGGQRELTNESLTSLVQGFLIAMVGVYAVLGGMLRSYIQPIVIMIAIPLGLVGSVVGHQVLGYDLTIMSVFGLVALSGVVVNDSLVLVDHINVSIREGKSVTEAVFMAGEARFRAVTLTSITTIAGLMPLLGERSSQAQSVIPMAISLAFGLLFATVLTLFIVPSLFLLLNDARRAAYWLRFGGAFPGAEVVEEAYHERPPQPSGA